MTGSWHGMLVGGCSAVLGFYLVVGLDSSGFGFVLVGYVYCLLV